MSRISKRFFLWLNIFFAGGHFTGHLFDTLVIIPNWKAGTIDNLIRYNDFFVHTDPGSFFSIFVIGPTVMAIICFILYFKSKKEIKIILGIGLIITIISTLSTFLYFFPINNYLFWGEDTILDPSRTKTLAAKWVLGEWFRLALGFITLIISARALHLSYDKKNS